MSTTSLARSVPADKKAAKAAKAAKTGAKGDKPKSPDGPKKKRPLWLRILFWGSIAGFSLVVAGITTIAIVFWMYGRDPNLPDIEKLSDYKPRQVTQIVDASGNRIGELYGRTVEEQVELAKELANPELTPEKRAALQKKLDEAKKEKNERRMVVPFEKIPTHVVDAFVAAEDNSFWTHGGVDYWGMLRAFVANLRAGHTTQGASTITQQVVKNLVLTRDRTFKRKIQEIILARRLEKSLTKEEIVTIYMNDIYFGRQRYGVQEAARYYFGKDVEKIDVGEAAVLGSLPKEPETLGATLELLRDLNGKPPNEEQLKKLNRLKDRQVYVLNQLVEMGKLTSGDAQSWIEVPIKVPPKVFDKMDSAPEWRDLVRKELMATKCKAGEDTCPEGEAYLDKLGGTIKTTLDPKLQMNALHALQTGLRKFDERHHVGTKVRTVKKDAVAKELAKLAKNRKGAPVKGETYEGVVTSVHDDDREVVLDLGDYEAVLAVGGADDERFNPPVVKDGKATQKSPSERFSAGDVFQVVVADVSKDPKKAPKHAEHRVAFPTTAEGAVVVIDVHTRKVRALVGGYSTKRAGFNRATQAHRQPGSSFKPFVYTAAIDRGADKGRDEGNTEFEFTAATRRNDTPENDRGYTPKNYESGHFDGPILLRNALAKSVNTISVIITERVTPQRIAELAHVMGIKSKLPGTDSIALGSGEVTPLELTNAIATLAAGGQAAEPQYVDSIDGVATPAATTEQVLKPEVAYVVTDMMKSVVRPGGTGAPAAELGVPLAGKTGTANDARDVWFMGITPDYAIGVWIGYDTPHSMGHDTGGAVAVPIFVDLAKTMDLKKHEFSKPPHVVDVKIDRETGLLPADGAPPETTVTEVFVDGTQPTRQAEKKGDVTDSNYVEGQYEKKKKPDDSDDTDKDYEKPKGDKSDKSKKDDKKDDKHGATKDATKDVKKDVKP